MRAASKSSFQENYRIARQPCAVLLGMCQHALEQQNPQRLLLLSLQALDSG